MTPMQAYVIWLDYPSIKRAAKQVSDVLPKYTQTGAIQGRLPHISHQQEPKEEIVLVRIPTVNSECKSPYFTTVW